MAPDKNGKYPKSIIVDLPNDAPEGWYDNTFPTKELKDAWYDRVNDLKDNDKVFPSLSTSIGVSQNIKVDVKFSIPNKEV